MLFPPLDPRSPPERRTKFPFLLLNFYGVLDAKYAGERAVIEGAEEAGYSYALARLGRLVGGKSGGRA